ncbi:MAG: DedA family protein, partial [Methyloprofundus sp.]|nr:DedA family protein [Methyloprofundus sp.]
VYLGAYFSDLICYGLGRKFGPKLLEIRFFANMVSPERITKISSYYEKYGVITLILGRFIPFGVRNALFLTAGLGKMNFIKFALSDLLACTISSVSFFTLYYYYGESVIAYIKQGNMVVFSLAFLLLGVIWYRKKKLDSLAKCAK